MSIKIIAAIGDNGLLGLEKDGTHSLPWHIPEDMKHFAHSTHGSPVIMGRTTWESLPERFRPLPGRANIVLSRNQNYELPEGASGFVDLGEAARFAEGIANGDKHVWVIGGASIYKEALSFADEIVLTRIAEESLPSLDPGATRINFPEFEHLFYCAESTDYKQSEKGAAYRFETWNRK